MRVTARPRSPLNAVLVLGLLHHHVKGPPFDYGALAAGCAASWAGFPGPGEPLLIAAGVLAGQGKLDLASVVLVAFFSAVGGGLAGWGVGLGAGRRVLTVRGPVQRWRRYMLERGDALFSRHPVLGILLAPAPMAGIHRVRPATYAATTVTAAAVWSTGIGVGAYLVGPAIVEAVNDEGTVAVVAFILLILGTVAAEVWRRRRRRRSHETARSSEG